MRPCVFKSRFPGACRSARIAIAGFSLLAAGLTPAADPMVVVSSSEQFTVRGQSLGRSPDSTRLSPNLILLDPALLAVTCENIRHALASELGWSTEWRGRIEIELRPAGGELREAIIQPIRYPERWGYRVVMPDETDPERLVRGVVEVLLMEYSDRTARERHGEIPPWLAPGLTAHLMAALAEALVLSPNREIVRTRVQRSPLEPVRTRLGTNALLTVDQLNWPAPGQFDEGRACQYEASAHLLVRELLRFRDGPACLSEMLSIAPAFRNWQTAFFRAFRPHFERLLEVEKWWALIMTEFLGRDPVLTWDLAESRQRLDEVLYTPVQVRLEKDDVPHDSQLTLSAILTEWEYDKQVPALRQKVFRLLEMKKRMASEVAELAEAYRNALETYLRGRNRSESSGAKPGAFLPARVQINSTLSTLRWLDNRRELLWNPEARRLSPPKSAKAGAAPAKPAPAKSQPGS